MRQDLIVSKSIVINASASKVWNVLTNPELIKEFLYGTETLTTWERGSEVVFQGEYNGQKYRDHGKVLENIENEKMIYSYWTGFSGLDDKPENYSTIAYELKKISNDETEFTWTQKSYSTIENYEHSKNGMDELLKMIKKIAERA
jgi:uncharacterized protein YndB with AHSA1/START domain